MNFDNINTLRALIPVGIKYAKDMLAETNDKLAEAVGLFNIRVNRLFADKRDIDINAAKEYLDKTGYDFAKAIQIAEEEKYGITGLVIRKFKDIETAVDKVVTVIEQAAEESFWLCSYNDERTEKLNEEQKTLVFLRMWMNYEDWEGDILIDRDIAGQWRKLGAEWIADELEKVIEFSKHNEKYWESIVYKSLVEKHLDLRDKLTGVLYNYIVNNINKFP